MHDNLFSELDTGYFEVNLVYGPHWILSTFFMH